MHNARETDLQMFPGGDLVAKGLNDLDHGLNSVEALVTLVARPRLIALGFKLTEPENVEKPYEHTLFEALWRMDPRGAHSTYNALIDRIVSFVESYGQIGRAS